MEPESSLPYSQAPALNVHNFRIAYILIDVVIKKSKIIITMIVLKSVVIDAQDSKKCNLLLFAWRKKWCLQLDIIWTVHRDVFA